MSLKTLIIGAGTKGALYPDERLTHAHAFSQNGFYLSGFYDAQYTKAVEATKKWGGEAFLTLDYALKFLPDVVCVTADDAAHFDVLKAIALNKYYKPSLVFTEKPFCQNARQAKTIAKLYQKAGITLSVNFSRRFLPEYRDLAQRIPPQNVVAMTGVLTKGIHNYSHMADLGQLFRVKTIETTTLQRQYLNIFEATLYCWDRKIEFVDHGAQIRIIPTKARDDYPLDRMLDYFQEETIPVDLGAAMGYAADNIRDHLLHGAPLMSTVENALAVMEACDKWRK